MKRCVICDRPITWTFWVCAACEEEWGLVDVDYKDWPEWVKALVSIERRRIYVEENLDVIYTDDIELFVDYERD